MLKILQARLQQYMNCNVQAGFRKGRGTIDQIANIYWIIEKASESESEVKLLSRVRLFATPWTAAYQAPPSMGFSRQEYWSGVPLVPEKPSISTLLTMPKPLTVWITINFENSERGWNTRPPDLHLEKSVCRSGSNS